LAISHPAKTITPKSVVADYRKVWSGYLDGKDPVQIRDHHERTRAPFLELMKRLCARLAPGARIAELGCGTAVDASILSAGHPLLRFYVSDISVEAGTVARSMNSAIGGSCSFFAADMAALPIASDSLHIIFTQGVMEHFFDPMPCFLEQVRVLASNGFLVVNVPQKFTGYTLHKHAQIRKGAWELGWEREFSYGDLRNAGRSLGLIEETVLGYGYWPSWKEPLFVLRDLMDKMYRRMPAIVPRLPQKAYTALWGFLEKRWGHYFMRNIVVVFRKTGTNK